jgi:hypothetical protein
MTNVLKPRKEDTAPAMLDAPLFDFAERRNRMLQKIAGNQHGIELYNIYTDAFIIQDSFASLFDLSQASLDQLLDTPLSRESAHRIYSVFWPSADSGLLLRGE